MVDLCDNKNTFASYVQHILLTFECHFKPNHKKQSDMVDPVNMNWMNDLKTTALKEILLSL